MNYDPYSDCCPLARQINDLVALNVALCPGTPRIDELDTAACEIIAVPDGDSWSQGYG